MTLTDPVVLLEHVYKKFARGERHATLREFLGRLLAPKKREELTQEEFWAVQDVSFSLKKGDALGIIGPNGSGKSTILKMLSGILRPDRGRFIVNGRLSALIEVGAGMHPDLTGRENVFLNASILGMTRKEIAAKFNSIVEFAGVEEFIDTPLKRYSSGMAVRLGFAVSAFIEPDVLLVDEVLAVGDTEFRNRCMNRMERMLKNGVTMVLVSHNLNEVRNLCEKTLMLFKGQTVMEGPSQKVLERYHQIVGEKIAQEQERWTGDQPLATNHKPVEITGVELLDGEGIAQETFQTGEAMTVRVHYKARRRVEKPRFEIELVWAAEDWTAAMFSNALDEVDLGPIEGEAFVDMRINHLLMEPNVYLFNVQIGEEGIGLHDQKLRIRFVMAESVPVPAMFGLEHQWSVKAETMTDLEPQAVVEVQVA